MLSSAARFQRSVLAKSQQMPQKSAIKPSSVGPRSLKATGSNKRRMVASPLASHTSSLLASAYTTQIPSVTAIKSGSSRNRNHFHFAYIGSPTALFPNFPRGYLNNVALKSTDTNYDLFQVLSALLDPLTSVATSLAKTLVWHLSKHEFSDEYA